MALNLKIFVKRFLFVTRSKLISLFLPKNFFFSYKGFCPCCDKKVIFSSTDSWLRDNFYCNNCFSIPRQRALMVVIEKYFPNWANLKIHESSPGDIMLTKKLKKKCAEFTVSQFFPDQPLGIMYNNFINIDLENQTFADNSFDIVLTQDVMEHIYDPAKAFIEIARTLKKGGAHIFTVPLVNKHKKTEVWAIKDENGDPEFLKTPEYHLNPVDSKGSPVTMHWGFDILEFIKKSSRLNTVIEHIDNLEYGIRAEYIEVLVSFKD